MYGSIALTQIYYEMDFIRIENNHALISVGYMECFQVSVGLWECWSAVGFCSLAATEYHSDSGAKEWITGDMDVMKI